MLSWAWLRHICLGCVLRRLHHWTLRFQGHERVPFLWWHHRYYWGRLSYSEWLGYPYFGNVGAQTCPNWMTYYSKMDRLCDIRDNIHWTSARLFVTSRRRVTNSLARVQWIFVECITHGVTVLHLYTTKSGTFNLKRNITLINQWYESGRNHIRTKCL